MSFSGALFDDDGYDARRLDSKRFDSFTKFDDFDSVADENVFVEESVFVDTPLPVYASGDGISVNSVDLNTDLNGFADMVYDEVVDEKCVALREWRRLNAIQLAEKDKVEKEMRNEILSEAEEFKADFYKRRLVTAEKMKVTNREKQKIFLENHEKFHNEAVANYWKAIAELVPKEVPALEKRGKKDGEKKKPSITVIQGPKPGKPTDLSRMRQILSMLKLHAHPHLTPASSDSKTNLPSGQAPPSQVVMYA